jgi:hypothetical protein
MSCDRTVGSRYWLLPTPYQLLSFRSVQCDGGMIMYDAQEGF